MDLKKIKDLLKIVSESGVAEVEIEDENLRVVVRAAPREVTVTQPVYTQPQIPAAAPAVPPAPVAPAAPATPPAAEPDESGFVQKAPIVGTFYKAPSPEADPFVQVGDTIQKGDVICIIEAMKLMNEIEAESGGIVEKVLVQNAEPVEYDQPLFIIKPA